MIADRINDKCSEIDEVSDNIKDLLSGAIEEMYHQKIDTGIIGNLIDAKGDIKKLESASNTIRHLAEDVQEIEDEHGDAPEYDEPDCTLYKWEQDLNADTQCTKDIEILETIQELYFRGHTSKDILDHLQFLTQ